MTETEIGPLKLVSSGTSLEIELSEGADFPVSLDPEQVHSLIAFLISLATTDFNQRQTFRVLLWPTCGLSVCVQHEGASYPAEPKNISATGIYVDFLTDQYPEQLVTGTRAEVRLEFEGDVQTYSAIVCRTSDSGCGLFFPESLTGEEIEAPDALMRTVMELQRRLMMHRSKDR